MFLICGQRQHLMQAWGWVRNAIREESVDVYCEPHQFLNGIVNMVPNSEHKGTAEVYAQTPGMHSMLIVYRKGCNEIAVEVVSICTCTISCLACSLERHLFLAATNKDIKSYHKIVQWVCLNPNCHSTPHEGLSKQSTVFTQETSQLIANNDIILSWA